MLIDLTLPITPELLKSAQEDGNKALAGHLGTHFDVMDKVFPLKYTQREGILFDVRGIRDRDIGVTDVALDAVQKGMFVIFFTGYGETEPYGTRAYFAEHPQLSPALLDVLLEKEVSMIGVDCAGVRRGKEHTPMDQRCADRNVFVIENLRNLNQLLEQSGRFTVNTYPLNATGITGLPCRVVAKI